MTNQEKLPFMGRIVGLETISSRMKDSLPELGRTILTWPQLASGVVLGGAIVSDVHRRIMTGEFTRSGRWWMDMEEHLREHTDNDQH